MTISTEFDLLLYLSSSLFIWKENILGDLKTGVLKYEITKKFLADLRKEFRVEDEEVVKVAKLKKF